MKLKHLNIKNKNSEIINPRQFHLLYKISNLSSIIMDLIGTIITPHAHKLEAKYVCGGLLNNTQESGVNSKLNVNVSDGWYVSFVDSNVQLVLIDNNYSSDNIGITESEWSKVDNIGLIFKDNQLITRFPELKDTKVDSLELAFTNCSSLIECLVPKGCKLYPMSKSNPTTSSTNIGVFEGCTNLKTMNFNDLSLTGLFAFFNCSKLEGTVNNLSDGGICGGAFYNTNINKVEYIGSKGDIGGGSTSVGAFLNCKNLQSVYMHKDNKAYYNTFRGCTNLTEVTLEEGLSKFGWYTFAECTSLEEFNLPSTFTELSVNSFNGATKLKTINTENITIINSGVFLNCSSLENVELSNVISYGNYCFENTLIKNIEVNLYATTITPESQYGNSGFFGPFTNMKHLESIKFKGMFPVLSLNNNAILKKFEYPDYESDEPVYLLGNTFYRCDYLRFIELPKNCKIARQDVAIFNLRCFPTYYKFHGFLDFSVLNLNYISLTLGSVGAYLSYPDSLHEQLINESVWDIFIREGRAFKESKMNQIINGNKLFAIKWGDTTSIGSSSYSEIMFGTNAGNKDVTSPIYTRRIALIPRNCVDTPLWETDELFSLPQVPSGVNKISIKFLETPELVISVYVRLCKKDNSNVQSFGWNKVNHDFDCNITTSINDPNKYLEFLFQYDNFSGEYRSIYEDFNQSIPFEIIYTYLDGHTETLKF